MRVRLTHALGSQEFDLADRTLDDPVVIGRSTDADLQIPSIAISKQHAVMFVHNGEWVVQDAGSREGTFVNGQKITGPMKLAVGHTLTLGADASVAQVQIESLEAAPPQEPVEAFAGVAAMEFGEGMLAPASAASSASTATAGGAAAQPGVPVIKRKAKKSVAPIVVMSVACVVIVGAVVACIVGYVRWQNKQADAAAKIAAAEAAATVQKKAVAASESSRKTMFLDPAANIPKQPKAPATAAAPVKPPVDTTPKPTTVASNDPKVDPSNPDLKHQDPTEPDKTKTPADQQWERILEVHDSDQPAAAIYAYLEYKRQTPDSPNLKKVDQFLDEAFDTLWWQRINELVDMQLKLDEQIKDAKKEKADLPADKATPDRKAQFDQQVKNFESTKASNRLLLEGEMGYKKTTLVNIDDPAALAALRKDRPKDNYDHWCERVKSRVKTTRGASAW